MDKKELLCQAVAEGAVLLVNENNTLPVNKGELLSVYGRAQIDYYRSGTGSGGAVRVSYAVNLMQGLENEKDILVNTELAEIYRDWIGEHPFDNGGGGWAAEPWYQQDMPLSEELVSSQAARGGKALYVIGRTAGEDKDNFAGPGSYELTETEKANLELVCCMHASTILILNVSNLIDMQFIQQLVGQGSLQAVLYAWQGGVEGGNGAARILSGSITPSGKLTDTIAKAYEKYPSADCYGGDDFNEYREDIYVGYRYFETFAPEDVCYEFGYGLSYTDFAIRQTAIAVTGESQSDPLRAAICLQMQVTNTGNRYAGKEVVQVYLEAPQGRLGKPNRVLVDFQKTDLLAPGESQLLTFTLPVKEWASYDDSGLSGFAHSYVLEAGAYRLHVGNSVRQTRPVENMPAVCRISETLPVKQLEEILAPVQSFSRLRPGQPVRREGYDTCYELDYEAVPKRTVDLSQRIKERLPQTMEITGNQGIILQDVAAGKKEMDAFIAQLTEEELMMLVRAEGMGHPAVTPGTASAFGGVGDGLCAYGLPLVCTADGPSGIRMEGGGFATQLPIGTLLAATWNDALVTEVYRIIGREMQENKVDVLLGPGMNIHRNPLNGRNFEYFSEDPYLTGRIAIADAAGIQAEGGHCTLKHFACNNQEKRRHLVDSVVSERALREIYTKAFGMVVQSGYAHSVMTTYNPVNGYWTASAYDLSTTLLRREWQFEGIVMTDWWAKINHVIKGGAPDVRYTKDMVRAQNDLYMVVNNYGAEINAMGDDLKDGLKSGELTIGELQRAAKNICSFIMTTGVFARGEMVKNPVFEIRPLSSEETGAKEKGMTLETNIRYPMGEGKKLCLKNDRQQTLLVVAGIKSPDTNLFQTSGQLVINGEKAGFIQTQGTENVLIAQKLQRITIEPGNYEISFEVLKPHIEMEWIEFR